MVDLLGTFLKFTPHFRGKWRLQRVWERSAASRGRRIATLPEGSRVEADMSIPYERMIWLGAEEWDELRYLQHRLHRGETFVDVGANVGIWSLVAASTVGDEGGVFSFEPNPATFRKLVRNVELNGQTQVVRTLNQAVSRDNGTVRFSCPVEHNLSAITTSEDDDAITVPSVALDSVLEGKTVHGVKMDTEGHELATLEGASRTLERSSPWLIIEFNTTLLSSPVLGDWSVYKFLKAQRYAAAVYEGPGEAKPVDAGFSVAGYRNILFERNRGILAPPS